MSSACQVNLIAILVGKLSRMRLVPLQRVCAMLCLSLAVILTTNAGRYGLNQPALAMDEPTVAVAEPMDAQQGLLLIAGGGNLPERVQRQFVELAGGKAARLVMVPGVYVDEADVKIYRDEWSAFGPASIQIMNASSAEDANDETFTAALNDATGVWLGGGQQTWLASCYRGSLAEQKIKRVLERRGIVGGTSAGAAVMSEVMITGGHKEPAIGTGFGFLPGVVIDQHFIKRNRFSRLRQVLEAHPELVGIGIDEDASLLVSRHTRRVRVVGDSYIVVCLPEKIGTQHRVEVDFYNPGDEFELAEPGHPEKMLAHRASEKEDDER